MAKINWETFNQVVFNLPIDESGKLEEFLKSKKKKSFWDSFSFFRVTLGGLSVNALESKNDKVAVIGIGKITKRKRVQCPYCKEIQKLKSDYQKCTQCNRKFHLFDD